MTAYCYTNKNGKKYFLHAKDVSLSNGRKQRIYFFTREEREGSIPELPAGLMVKETTRTGMPVLHKIKE